ncbi:MAG TPA: amino acid adenylation domain-containing protein [Ruminiclostridium sp.]|nr:amino acid adenylation domain-containing protein [Ruminiclostridium sp.]
MDSRNLHPEKDIAVIGMAGRFPEAENLQEFWENLANSRDSVKEFPENRRKELEDILGVRPQTDFIRLGYLERITYFEPEIFSLSEEESRYMDPQQRLLLELTEEAFLDAGYNPEDFYGKNAGVFVTCNQNQYTHQLSNFCPISLLNGLPSSAAGRISYTYNLLGPSILIDSACSSALVAIHSACQSLRSGESDMAVAGGVNITLFPIDKESIPLATIYSPDQKAKAFDKEANGTIMGEGGGIIILKRLDKALSDGDPIHAVIKGSAVNSDGRRSNGMAAPSQEGQTEVILKAMENADIDPQSISYLEAHGTGTNIGDPIEVSAIGQAYGKLGYSKKSVPMGSVKTNIGHLDYAAGIASLIKTILMLKNKTIPASIHFNQPNPLIDFENSPVYVNSKPADWKSETPRRAGITSLGMVGTNSHIILEEAETTRNSVKCGRNIIVLSARTEESLYRIAERIRAYTAEHPHLCINDIAYTLNKGRRRYKNTAVFTADNCEELIRKLDEFIENRNKASEKIKDFPAEPSAVFIFPDIRCVDFNEIPKLYHGNDVFRNIFEKYLKEIDEGIGDYDRTGDYILNLYSYAKLMEEFSLKPKAVIGFGTGDAIAELVIGNIGFEECVRRVNESRNKELAMDNGKLEKLVDIVLESKLNTFTVFCPSEETANQLSSVLSGKQGIHRLILSQPEHSFYTALGELIENGVKIDWEKVYQYSDKKRIHLPGYAFDRKSYFIRAEKEVRLPSQAEVNSSGLSGGKSVREVLHGIFSEICSDETLTEETEISETDFDSICSMQFIGKVKKAYGVDVPIKWLFEDWKLGELFTAIEEKISSQTVKENTEAIQPQREFYPASSAQKRMYVLTKLDPGNTVYNLPSALILEGKADKERIESVFVKLIQRHEALRTSFTLVDREPVQKIHQEVDFKIEYDESQESDIDEKIKEFIRPFALDTAPLFRLKLIRLGEDRHLFLYDIHHIIADATSIGIIVREFVRLYEGETPETLKFQYKDYAIRQSEQKKAGTDRKSEEYWLKCFEGEIPVLDLPVDYPRGQVQSFEGDRIYFETGEALTVKLDMLAKETGTSLFMVLMAAYNVLLHKYTGQEDIVVGTPVSGRPHADYEKIIGVFVNTLAMRNFPKSEKTFREFLNEVRENSLNAYENQEYPFEELVEKLGIRRDMSRSPLYDVLFTLQSMTLAEAYSSEIYISGLRFIPYTFNNGTSKFDMTFNAIQYEKHLKVEIEYCTKLFKKETVERFAAHFLRILEQITVNPAIRLDEIELLGAEEKEQLLYAFNNSNVKYADKKMAHNLFEEQARLKPDNIALVFGDIRWTYGELDKKADCIAAALMEKGVKRGSIVGIMTKRSPELFAGIMGILKAGGAYLPIDPGYPEARVRYMIEDSGAAILLTERDLKEKTGFGGEVVFMEEIEPCHSLSPEIKHICKPNDLAYMIYTSGSTGNPKGVMIEHGALRNFIHGMSEKIEFAPGKTILGLTTVSFDIFALETFIPLAKGMKIVIADEEEQMDSNLLGTLLRKNKVDMVQMTPSRMRLLLSNGKGAESLEYVRDIIIGGEAFPEALLAELKSITSSKIYNVYGPTETTVWSSINELTQEESVTIGKPIANTQIFIMDNTNRLQPINVTGELCIGGDGLARGYWNREALTKEKFVINPYTGKRMYRTGDMAKWLPNGDIQILGRSDHQVKIRGYRVELEEIEKHISQYENIKECVVASRKDSLGNQILAAYYVSDGEINISRLRTYLAGVLPDYMIPGIYMNILQIPRTANGKTDRSALPEPEMVRPVLENEYVEPSTETEKQVYGIWSTLLNRENIGTKDNFFDIGGNSLLLVQMHAELDSRYPGKVSVAEIFAYPTIAKLASLLSREAGEIRQGPVIEELQMPGQYMADGSADYEGGAICILPEPEIEENLKALADSKTVQTADILLGGFVYLLSEVSGKQVIPLHVLNGPEWLTPLKLNMDNISTVHELVSTVGKNLREKSINIGLSPRYPVKARPGRKSDSAAVLFAYNAGSLQAELLNIYDIAFRVEEENGAIAFTVEYNAKRIDKSAMEEFIQLYINVLKVIFERMV